MRTPLLLVLAGCAHASAVGELRFKNEAPVWRVNDRVPLAKMPAVREYNRTLYHVDGFVVRRATRALDVRPQYRAEDVNALDEVPSSTWFTNRIGVRDMTLDEIRRGPNVGANPFEHRPWRIMKVKDGGMSIGYVFEDTHGDKYILKFDDARLPEMETAAHAIVHRILWACGYNVPEDYVGYVRRSDLVVGDKAKGLDEARLDRQLARVYQTSDGRIRVLASRYLPGKPIGPYAREGTRPDDPNDMIRHERRRSLRGQYSIFAWLNHTDLQEDNTIDVFRDGHVEHYLIDFGEALGVMGAMLHWTTVGYTYRLDLALSAKSLFTFGLWDRPWEGQKAPVLRGIGLYEAAHFDPGQWRPNSFYWPYEDKDRFDAFWGAKLVMRFSRAQLAAIVEEAQYSDPRAAAYMLETLVQRQRATARYWFDRVTPVDQVAITGQRLCFTDLTLAYQLRRVATRYVLELFDDSGAPIGPARRLDATANGRVCTDGVIVGGYTIARVHVIRNATAMPNVAIHLAPDDAGRPRVVGLRRD
jgi:hypothetical protein